MNNENSMREANESKHGLNRRDALKGVAAVSLGLATGAYGAVYAHHEKTVSRRRWNRWPKA